MYERILLPVDGSERAAEIVHHAAELAQWTDATIDVLFVADTTRDSITVVETNAVDALEQKGADIVADIASTLESLGVDHGTDVVQGNPAPTIVDYADRYDYDLTVLPTRGRSGLSRYLLGSVTEKVVRLSEVPVLTARMRPDERLVFPYENVLIPTDGSAGSKAAAKHGLALAETLDATVSVLSVVDDSSLGIDVRSVLSEAELERPASDAVKDVVTEADEYELVDVRTHVEHGSPPEVIRESIETHDIHAVVMGTSGRRGADRILLGSVTERTIRSAPVPVVTVGDHTRSG